MVRTRASKRVAAAAAAEAPGLIAQLPEELLLHVLSSCSSAEDLVACAGVARAWKELAMDPSAWSRHWQLAYGSRPRPTSLAAEFARLRLCGDAAILLGEWDYVGFYEETLRPNEKYVMAFWLRAWPSMVLNGNGFHEGICGVVNYVFLEPAPEMGWYPGCEPGFYGGEEFVAMWDWKLRRLEGKGTQLIDGNSTAEDMLVLTPFLDLHLDPTGHGISASQTFKSGAMATRHAGHPLNGRPHHEVVRMDGVLRGGDEPLALLRGMRPNADLAHLPPGDSWRPKRRDLFTSPILQYSGFDMPPPMSLPKCVPSSRRAAMQHVVEPLRVSEND